MKSCRQRAPFVSTVPGELRRCVQDPLALPPFPCRLCSQGFATRRLLMTHIDAEHVLFAEYRKRLFFLLSSFEAVEPIRPQVWRHATDEVSHCLCCVCASWRVGWALACACVRACAGAGARGAVRACVCGGAARACSTLPRYH